ncbi:hypothetical protein P4637_02860 [Halalkalibacterium halodurans]|jgi:hypothetical protein|uniref:BH1341 protein n=2 Tax=Halalkalibacterium halodurans TaxID=86665 RepID=Q9KD77_HALH5|nr:hypothetical protein [Halalkalibacterium halodurans]MDY7221867.1 hypothetical protein [Halalkalibacterium halodurans]MDY7241143.1 hypothetical protein [Halalkalibacterium halodurans]MED3648170.1 hypothetical protein [Halalkalibacterium halodurans]MED4080575.1 hypothetical protein [Halalkalibacterium halodurans]MED4083803.1 hypothetical protein [Halalkalibacterium halodurans]
MRQVIFLCVACIVVGLTGALFGVQQMNEHLGLSEPEPLVIEERPEKQREPSDERLQETMELAEKQERNVETGQFNFFSALGEALANGVNQGTRFVLATLSSWFHDVLNGSRS